jgi:hypothetical protein
MAKSTVTVGDDDKPFVFLSRFVFFHWIIIQIGTSDQSTYFMDAERVLVGFGLAQPTHIAWLCEESNLLN